MPIRKTGRVAIRCSDAEGDLIARPESVPAHHHISHHFPVSQLVGALKSQNLLYRRLDAGRVSDQPFPFGRVGQQHVNAIADQFGGGLVAGVEQKDAVVEQFELTDLAPILLGQERGQDAVLSERAAAALETQRAVVEADDLRQRGNEAYRRGDSAEAEAAYKQAIDALKSCGIALVEPSHLTLRTNRAAALMALGRTREALRECEEVLRINPHNVRALSRAGNCCVKLGDLDAAKTHVDAICLAPGAKSKSSRRRKTQLGRLARQSQLAVQSSATFSRAARSAGDEEAMVAAVFVLVGAAVVAAAPSRVWSTPGTQLVQGLPLSKLDARTSTKLGWRR